MITFPVPGYKPLQEPRWGEIRQAQALLRYLERLVSILLDDDKVYIIVIIIILVHIYSIIFLFYKLTHGHTVIEQCTKPAPYLISAVLSEFIF